MSSHASPLHGSLASEGTAPPAGGLAVGRMNATEKTLEVVVNGETQTTTATTLQDWVLAQNAAPESLATAVNGQFIPRTQRAATVLRAGDAILTFQPIVGG